MADIIPRQPAPGRFCDQADAPFRQPGFVPQKQLNGLKPLGNPAANGIKFFATAELLELMKDRAWLPEDKGARLVRYSKLTNRVGIRFSWVSPGGYLWRSKLGAFCRVFGLNPDNHKIFLKQWYGKNWIYDLRPLIDSIKLPEFYPEPEAQASLRSVWLTINWRRQEWKHRP